MRVIAGTARGRHLVSPTGSKVRPTSDRVKEALFSTLTSMFGSLAGVEVLDLFAGSGALGIEALSRGAARTVFVDSHPDSLRLIRKNLQLTGFASAAEVLMVDALKALDTLTSSSSRFDLILADPPYAETAIYGQLLGKISAGRLLTARSTVVLEADHRIELQPPEDLQLLDRRRYGDTALWFFSS